jgi:hypothetical protein
VFLKGKRASFDEYYLVKDNWITRARQLMLAGISVFYTQDIWLCRFFFLPLPPNLKIQAR